MAPIIRRGAPSLTVNTNIDTPFLLSNRTDFPKNYKFSPLEPSPVLQADDLYSGHGHGDYIIVDRRADRVCRCRTRHADLRHPFEKTSESECDEEEEDEVCDEDEDGFQLVRTPSQPISQNREYDDQSAIRKSITTIVAPGSRVAFSHIPINPEPAHLTRAKSPGQKTQSESSFGKSWLSTVASVKTQFSTLNDNMTKKPRQGAQRQHDQGKFLKSGLEILNSTLSLQQGDDDVALQPMPRELKPQLFQPPPAYKSNQFYEEDFE